MRKLIAGLVAVLLFLYFGVTGLETMTRNEIFPGLHHWVSNVPGGGWLALAVCFLAAILWWGIEYSGHRMPREVEPNLPGKEDEPNGDLIDEIVNRLRILARDQRRVEAKMGKDQVYRFS